MCRQHPLTGRTLAGKHQDQRLVLWVLMRAAVADDDQCAELGPVQKGATGASAAAGELPWYVSVTCWKIRELAG